MAKKSDKRFILALKIFWEGITIYCNHMFTFLKYMSFPVIGMLIGLILIFTVNYFFVVNVPSLIKQYPILDNIPLVFLLLLICVFPGFLVFCKAFFDYILAFASLNSMVFVARGGKMKNKPIETHAHDDVLKKRLGKYCIFLLMLAGLSLVGSFPLLLIPFGVVCIYLCLVFQVFMLEENVSPVQVFGRSFHLVKGNFAMTSFLLGLSFLLTYILIPSLFVFIFEKANLLQYIALPIQKYLNILPIEELSDNLTQYMMQSVPNSALTLDLDVASLFDTEKYAISISSMLISLCVIEFLLPMRSAWFTLLYKLFDEEKTDELRRQGNK